jgi:hypothetical protein
MLQRRSTVAHKGQKESPVQAIETKISRGEHGSKMTMSAVPSITLNDGNTIPHRARRPRQPQCARPGRARPHRSCQFPVCLSGVNSTISSVLSGWKVARTLYISIYLIFV